MSQSLSDAMKVLLAPYHLNEVKPFVPSDADEFVLSLTRLLGVNPIQLPSSKIKICRDGQYQRIVIRFNEGDEIEDKYCGRGKWFPGKISRDRGDGTYDIFYNDGESEMRVPEDMIRLLYSAKQLLVNSA
jgi:hypothetical protein